MHPSIQSHPRKSPWGRPPGSDIVWPRPMFLDLPRGSQSMARDAPGCPAARLGRQSGSGDPLGSMGIQHSDDH